MAPGGLLGGLVRGFVAAGFARSGGTQAGEAMVAQQLLPRLKLIFRQGVALACLGEGNQTAVDAGDDLGLVAHAPPFDVGGRQIFAAERHAGRATDQTDVTSGTKGARVHDFVLVLF